MAEYGSIQDFVRNGTESEHLDFIHANSPAILLVNGTAKWRLQSLHSALNKALEEVETANILTITCVFKDQPENLQLEEIHRLLRYL